MSRRSDPHWEKLPLPVAWLCELDECEAVNALGDAFGDRYLYKHCPLFRQIRDIALELGYRYTRDDTTLLRDYASLPLLTLQRILEERNIPYFDNGASVGRLVRSQPKLKLPGGIVVSLVRPNHVFHESAHCVAHAALQSLGAELTRAAGGERERFVLQALFEESFANAAEHLAGGFHHMPVPDAVFYSLNSYMNKSDEDHRLRSMLASPEPPIAFGLLFFSLFEANLTEADPDEAVRYGINEAAQADSDHASLLEAAIDLGFALSEGFRQRTTPNYFRLMGYLKEYESLAASRWLGDPVHRDVARQIADTLFPCVALAAGKSDRA